MELFKRGYPKLLAWIIAVAMVFTISTPSAAVWAGEAEDAITIGNESYASLQEAVNAATTGDEIDINRNMTSSGITIENGKNFTVDLNGNTLITAARVAVKNGSNVTFKDSSGDKTGMLTTSAEPIFLIENGELTLDSGKYHSTCQYDFAFGIALLGSTQQDASNYSIANVNEDATVSFEKNGYGIIIDKSGASEKKYGAVANIAGTIKGTGTKNGGSVYINGTMKDMTGQVPKVNVAETAVLKGAVYAAGYGIWDIDGGDFEGFDALSIKSGDFDISGGTFKSTGAYHNPSLSNNNGSEDTGAVISMTSNDGYAEDIHMNISGGTFQSTNGNALYEGISKKDGTPAASATHVKELSISGGTFIGADGKDAVSVTQYNEKFINGGTFNTSPLQGYLEAAHKIVKDGENYKVLSGYNVDCITFNTTYVAIEVGNKEQLIATVYPENADDKDFVWASDDPETVSVDDNGVLKALKEKDGGVTNITATTKDGGHVAMCAVAVLPNISSDTTIKIQPTVTGTGVDAVFNSDDIIETLSNAQENENVVIVASDDAKAPTLLGDVFKVAATSTAPKIIIETKPDTDTYGAKFEFNVSEINNPVDVKTQINKKATDNSTTNQLPNGASPVGLELEHEGDFPATTTLTVDIGDGHDGDAYLYYVPTAGTIQLTNNGKLAVEDGKVSFKLSHASEYVISNKQISAEAAADSVEALITAIGDVNNLEYTSAVKNKIREANEAYEGFRKQYTGDKLDLIENASDLADAKSNLVGLQTEVEDAVKLIEKIGTVSNPPTEDQIEAILLAYNAVAALSNEQYKTLAQPVLDDLDAARDAVIAYTTATVEEAIKKVPALTSIQLSDEATVKAARSAYDYAIKYDMDNLAKSKLSALETTITKAEARIVKAKSFDGNISLSKTKVIYNGKAQTPVISFNGLEAGKDYSVTYSNNKKVGKATVTVKGINDCLNLPEKTATFTITPTKSKISKVKKAKKSFNVTIKSQKKSGVTGYQIAYSTKKKSGFKKTFSKKTTKTIKKLKAKKTYYVKVRAYKVIDGKKVYGNYSSIKKIKTK